MDVFFMRTAHLFGLLALMSAVQQANSWKIRTPTTVTAVEGSCVVVPCHTEPHTRVIWYKYHKMNYPVVYDGERPRAVEHQFIGRTSILGKASEGSCSLVIENVSTHDNQLKIYVWINPGSDISQKFHEQTVTILVVRKTPSISVPSQIVEGEAFLVNCTIEYSCRHSTPSLQWQTNQLLENSTEKVVTGSLWDQWLFMETRRGEAKHHMHNSKMRCSAQFRTFTTHSHQATLNILHKPVNVSVVLEDEAVKEGGDVSVNCTVDANPEPETYAWFRKHMNQTDKLNSTQRRITLNSIKRHTSLSCTASNNVGTGQSEWLDLDVQYAPMILNETSCSQVGDVLKCVCQAKALPNASLYWVIDGNHTSPSSFISKFTKEKHLISGEISTPAKGQTMISCIAWNPLGNDTKQMFIENSSSKPSLLIWWMLFGTALLLGCALFIHRKYPRKSSTNSVVVIEDESAYSDPQRIQHEATELEGAEGNPEQDVYENDLVIYARSNIAR